MGKLWDDMINDPECNVNTRIAPESYYDAHWWYNDAENADFSTMVICAMERAKVKPGMMREYHEWISYYMDGLPLNELELIYRQQLAQRINE